MQDEIGLRKSWFQLMKAGDYESDNYQKPQYRGNYAPSLVILQTAKQYP